MATIKKILIEDTHKKIRKESKHVTTTKKINKTQSQTAREEKKDK